MKRERSRKAAEKLGVHISPNFNCKAFKKILSASSANLTHFDKQQKWFARMK